ncbi:MAG TPA: hypothetical protein VKC60_04330, partial [Opitutaceae bacterium]|nr:hypothetical protein [Opitutaceae bacterium]
MKNPANMIGGFGKFCLMYSFFLVANIFVVQNLRADPKSVSGYAISVFATAPSNFTGPDSITSAHGNIFVSYTNGAAKDGSSGSSVIVQYDTKGTVLHTYTVAGRNDGLKYNPYDKMLWALRNEDGNPQLTLINPETGASQDLTYAVNPPAHGGGYDDVAFLNGKVYLSASNPTVDAKGQNNFPSIVSATIVGSKVQVAPVLLDNAVLTNITTGSKTTSLQSDPDSLKIGPDHALFLTS